MRSLSRLALSAALLTLLVVTAFPQKRFCPKPPPSPFKHDGEIVTVFDSRAGGMRTTLQHPRPLGGGANLYYMAASFMHQSTTRPGTPMLDLVIYAAAPGAQMAGQGLALVLDGRPLALTTKASYRSQPGAGGAVRLTLSYAEASALTHARRVEARLGGAGVELTNNHLEALREMLSLMAPSPGRWQTADALTR
ncbi:MAG TPA: hypothetical protein VNZ44_08055 [Pyrinomonadaceae bacterium]|nr:hypothetical protein [Pyrinomonadaceae bacterium]